MNKYQQFVSEENIYKPNLIQTISMVLGFITFIGLVTFAVFGKLLGFY